MEHVRILVEAPRDGEIFVIDATPVSTVVDLTTPPYAPLLEAIGMNLAIRVQAEPQGVVWKALKPDANGIASGVVAVNATTTPTATANQVGGYTPAEQDPAVLYHFDPRTSAIVLMAATGSGHLRLTLQR